MDLKPQQKLGQYTVLRKLAEGGMAEIHPATRSGASGFSKICVLKRVKEQFRRDRRFRELFEREAKLAALLEHSNIVQIFDFQNTDGELLIAMQHVDGCSLEQLRRRMPTGAIPPFLAAKIARDMASALAYAYQRLGDDGKPLQLVHRDISPHNILLDRQGEAKLADFGVAKPVSKDTTGGFKGKFAYMAPEQAQQKKADHRTDIFSLGVVLYESCTGTRPFDAANDVAFIMMMQTASEPAPRASKVNPQVPEALANVLEIALRRNPDNRYQTAEEFGRALDDVLRLAPSQVDVDLKRFVEERLGADVPEPAPGPLLHSAAFEDTRLSAKGPGTAVQGAAPDAVAATLVPGDVGTPLQFQALDPKLAAPQSRSTPAPRPDSEEAALDVVRSDKPTFQALPSFAESGLQPSPPRGPEPVTAPSTSEHAVAPLLTRPMKLALAVLVPAVIAGGALTAYRLSRLHDAVPTPVAVAAPPPVALESPKPAPVVATPAPAPQPEPPTALKPPAAEVKPPVAADKPPVVAAPQPSAPVVEAPPRPHPSKPAFHGVGTLVLNADPYALVTEGRKKISDDGIGSFELPAGRHMLKFKYDTQTVSREVVAPENQRVCLKALFAQDAPPVFSRCSSP